jgi:hypothetical protein
VRILFSKPSAYRLYGCTHLGESLDLSAVACSPLSGEETKRAVSRCFVLQKFVVNLRIICATSSCDIPYGDCREITSQFTTIEQQTDDTDLILEGVLRMYNPVLTVAELFHSQSLQPHQTLIISCTSADKHILISSCNSWPLTSTPMDFTNINVWLIGSYLASNAIHLLSRTPLVSMPSYSLSAPLGLGLNCSNLLRRRLQLRVYLNLL